MDELMPIGAFADATGLSPKRLRSYAAAGLLVPAAVDAHSGYRYYSPGQVTGARLIDALREAGVPLAEIAGMLRDPSGERLDGWARRLERDVERRQDALEVARKLLPPAPATWSAAGHDDRTREDAMTTFETAVRTVKGRGRDENQDEVVGTDRLALVADGMGGAPGGGLASAVAASLVRAAYTGRSVDELLAAVRAANRAICDRAAGDVGLEGMGTTICAAGLTDRGEVAIVHVGDSRAYLVRDGSLRRLTDDHTVTADLVRAGELSERDAAAHPHRRVLTRALGVGPDVDVGATACRPVGGDRLVLCSDGLFAELGDDEIASAVASAVGAGDDLDATAEDLIALARSRNGPDDASVVAVAVRP